MAPTATNPPASPGPPGVISVAIGRWAVAAAPARIKTLLGSCVGVVLFDRVARVGGLAHIVLPDSRGAIDQPGKFADTAIPAMVADMEALLRVRAAGRVVAKLAGGASMFATGPAAQAGAALNIGRMNAEAAERILAGLRIPIVARDLGGESGRHLTMDTASGIVAIRIPGGADHEI
ncbi:Chemoreceptor glutamine deamidase CheD [Aquisphaera giovannonii]|uniref:Probable chemoreceptor glutamine deamidase CheD n=1 Tax=Aquisphaera giovannonii TaxID=406548 RepID=A0A5B9VV81_9BACT|nr:chemotaxis protein CheD [Aquisphaera giovannonii]QEH31675.1 Chemoreceptor glutamine deamidase CheD [Aquisphaera giovannonii]